MLQDHDARPARHHRQSGRSARCWPPADVVRRDEDDPYLVVAADKGTATFSDIANAVSAEYGFWLGDAFASGGSAGYDHKKMAITARGAWESVKRHFREIGSDIQREPFTVVGVGDMSGDVFGNGMLLSEQIRLARRLQPPPYLHRPRSRSGGRPLPSASGSSTCRAPPGPTTIRSCSRPAAGSTTARRNRSRSRPRRAGASASRRKACRPMS